MLRLMLPFTKAARKHFGWLVFSGFFLVAGCATPPSTAGIRLNQIQVIGTHNSYHQRANDSLMKLIADRQPQAARDLDYEHRPLPDQLSQLGMRELELDCYADPDGGRFAHPTGPAAAIAAGLPPVPANDPNGELLKPGIKVMHIPDIDYGTSVLSLIDGLQQIRAWSLAHPHHVPVFILIELKDESLGAGYAHAEILPWRQPEFAELEREILTVFSRQEILAPDDIRGTAKTLPEALQQHGWPLLDDVRGKVMFGLDNEGTVRDLYLQGHPALEGRLLFANITPENPAAAWMEFNDPMANFDKIQDAVKAGYLVRTRADEPTENARANDGRMRDHALASGAQFISTDYAEPNLKFSPYCVRFENHQVARVNPVNGPAEFKGQELE